MSITPPTTRLRIPPGEDLRCMLAGVARALGGPEVDAPTVPVEERHRRLSQAIATGTMPPEGWLALQPGLATIGDGSSWASVAARGRTALAVGGVHGPDRRAAFQCLRDRARQLGFVRQAVYPLRLPDREAAVAAGFGTVPIGTEAWVELERFSLRGRRFADLRQMHNRATKHGVVVVEVEAAAWRRRLEAAWASFLQERPDPWRVRWLSGGPELSAPWGRRTFVAHRGEEVHAFCTLLPGAAGVASLDVMCRAPGAQAGAMEALLVEVLGQLRREGSRGGVRQVSLGPCPLAGHAQAARGPWGAAMRWAWSSDAGNRWFGFRRLAAFKEKLRPVHEPVFLAISPRISALGLLQVARIWALGE